MAEKKSPKKKEAKAAPAETPAPAAQAPAAPAGPAATAAAPEAPKVIGPGVMKRPKRDPNAPPPPGEVPDFKPSEQVFRRRG